MDKLGLLVKHDDLPPEAKTPQEALVDARRKILEAQARASELEGENVKLKAELLDAEKRYKDLFDVSGGGKDSAKSAQELEGVKKALDEAAKDRDALKKENEELKAAAKKAGRQ
jgi:predicted  nucleic acid-binding Zn-ribbon protein